MKFVKDYKFNGVDTRQTACIELQAPPSAATEGAVGVLAINVNSPTYEVYKCVAVNGSVYTWQLLSSGMSILSSRTTGEGLAVTSFTYSSLRTTESYVIKVGDLILDSLGYLYRVVELGSTSCVAEYCYLQMNGANGVGISSVETSVAPSDMGDVTTIILNLTNGNQHSFTVRNGASAYQVAVDNGFAGTVDEWLTSLKATAIALPGDSTGIVIEEKKRYRIIRTSVTKVIVNHSYEDTRSGYEGIVNTDIEIDLPEYVSGYFEYGMEFYFSCVFTNADDNDTHTLYIYYICDGEKFEKVTNLTIPRGYKNMTSIATVKYASKGYLLNDTGEIPMYPTRIEDGNGNVLSKVVLEEIETEDGLILNIKTS